ncbi:MAG: hypothetical protein ACXVCY_04400 [Pseudobdellovibrionaceae bacterium]
MKVKVNHTFLEKLKNEKMTELILTHQSTTGISVQELKHIFEIGWNSGLEALKDKLEIVCPVVESNSISPLKCPSCGSMDIMTERRPDGDHVCSDCHYRWPNK